MVSMAGNYRNRIVGQELVAPDQLLANPGNWRTHPKPQQAALEGALSELGWIQRVIVNRTTGRMIDGHLRVSLALRHGEPAVPVSYVELSEAEEALALATFDPIGALAGADREQLDALLREVSTGDAALQEMLGNLAGQHGIVPEDMTFREYDELVADEVEYLTCPECGHRWPK